jgi:alpha-L-fucosidase 2
MGAINLGSFPKEVISVNHDTIWSQSPFKSPKPRSRKQKLQETFDHCLKNNFAKAEKSYSQMIRSGNKISSYQYLGEVNILHINPTLQGKKPNIRRTLNLLTGESVTTSQFPEGTITQNIIASYPDKVIIIHLQSTLPDGLQCQITYNRSEGVTFHRAENNTISFLGKVGKKKNHSKTNGTAFASQLCVISENDGKVFAENNRLILKGGESATLIISATTNHNRKSPRTPLTGDWQKKSQRTLTAASKSPWKTLRAKAVKDHRDLMLRNVIELGTTPPEITKLPLPERHKRFKQGGNDPDLIELFYQLGRHMLISSSRPGSLPPNLQGLWEGGTRAAWNGDFHLNINVQMNMWLANLTGLNECNEPFLTLIKCIHTYGQETAQSLGCRGYAAGLASDAWGFSDFANSNLDWSAFTLGGHWAQQHIMEEYRFTRNRDFLKSYAWPILKDGSGFILDWLREDPETGHLIAGPDGSPENIFLYKDAKGKQHRSRIDIGNTFGNAIAWETFTDTLECAKILGINDPILDEIRKALPRVQAPGISSDGRIMEWRKEYKEFWPGHRHKSHLYGFHPGHQFSLTQNPKLAQAAMRSLAVRMKRGNKDANGGGQTGWNLAWSINLYARLHRGDDAMDMLTRQIRTQVAENLFNHCNRPYQIDGNLGAVAGIAEMLMQSFETSDDGTPIIRILPALPKAWPNGEVRGLRARGGFIVDLQWKNGKITQTKITSILGKPATLIINGQPHPIQLKKLETHIW